MRGDANNQPDKEHERDGMRGGGADERRRPGLTRGGGATRGNAANGRGGQEATTPEKKGGMMRGGGSGMRGGWVKAPPDGRWQRDKKQRWWRIRGNAVLTDLLSVNLSICRSLIFEIFGDRRSTD
jgi:hypothetical protein